MIFAQNLQKYMIQKENAEKLQIEKQEANKRIEEQKKTIVRPTHEELILFRTQINELQKLNKKTFEVNAMIEELEQRREYIAPKAYNVEYNTLQQRLDNTNYQAFRIKKQIRNKLVKFYEFTGRIPKVLGSRVYDERTYYYNKIDQKIQNIAYEIENTESYGEHIAKVYKNKFNGVMPKEFQN